MTERSDELAELGAALDVTPPASFAGGVRARVARSRARTRQMWWGLAAAASVTLAVVMMWRPSADVPTGETFASAPAVSVPVPATIADAEASSGTLGRVASVRRVVTRSDAVPQPTTQTQPRLEVITNQASVLRGLWADVNGQKLTLVLVDAVAAPGSGMTPIVVEPIVVAPIVVIELGSNWGRGGATPIIRRVDAAGETK